MHLVKPLVSGIRGAERGTAIFTYDDKDGNTFDLMAYRSKDGRSRAGRRVSLDDRGSCYVFVDRMCTVTVLNETGLLLTTFVSACSAKSVETLSTLTDVAYQDRPTPPDVLELHPDSHFLSLYYMFENVISSFGAVDWNVLDGAVTKTIQSSFSSRIGYFYDVSSERYGGIVSAAVDAAAAAGGGIVFIPPGTWSLDGEQGLPETVSMLGVGAGVSKIRVTGKTNGVRVLESVSGRSNFIKNLEIVAGGAFEGAMLVFSPGARCVARGVTVTGTTGYPTLVRVEDSNDKSTVCSLLNCVLTGGVNSLYLIESMSTNRETRTYVADSSCVPSVDSPVYCQVVGTNLHFRSTLFSYRSTSLATYVLFGRNGAEFLNVSFVDCSINDNSAVLTTVIFDLGGIVEGDLFIERSFQQIGAKIWLLHYGDIYLGRIASTSAGFMYVDSTDKPAVLPSIYSCEDGSVYRQQSIRVTGATAGAIFEVGESVPVPPGSCLYMFACFKDDSSAGLVVYGDGNSFSSSAAKSAVMKLNFAFPQMCGAKFVRAKFRGMNRWFSVCVSGDNPTGGAAPFFTESGYGA